MSGEHTPTPWRVEYLRWTPESEIVGFRIDSDYAADHLPAGWRMHSIVNANCSEQPAYTGCWTPDQIEANAAFIVKAVNAHDELVDLLTRAREWVELGPELPGISMTDEFEARGVLAEIDAALAKATP